MLGRNLLHHLYHRTRPLIPQWPKRRVTLGDDIVFRHELEEGDGVVVDVWMEEDLVGDGFDGAAVEDLLQVGDAEAMGVEEVRSVEGSGEQGISKV